MPVSDLLIEKFFQSNEDFRKILAGQLSVQDFFTKPKYANSKKEFMAIYKKVFGEHFKTSMYSDENVAASWITKLRYNQHLSDNLFQQLIDRSERIFKGEFNQLYLKEIQPEDNDLCAIMWGIEALNGVQSFDFGATRVRLPEGVAPQIIRALEFHGAVPRDSTHAICTKLVEKGLGKDIEKESLRAYTPRGMGALLVIPTSRDGTGTIAKTSDTIQSEDYDLLLKREDYGYSDTTLHSRVHSKVGFFNYLTQHSKQYQHGMTLINRKSALAKKAEAETEFGKGEKIHRKEHLSELKGQSATLVNLLEAGKKKGLFSDFKTIWVIRIQWPPWEKKIVSASPNSRKGLGDFLHQLAEAEKKDLTFAKNNAKNLANIRELLDQAKTPRFGPFQQCREGNEVLVNCEDRKAVLVDNIAKRTKNDPVDRESLVPLGIVSEIDPQLTQQDTLRQSIKQLKDEDKGSELQP